MIKQDKLIQYNEARKALARGLVCHAPFTNINFEQNGNMTACCFNRVNVLGKYPASSIEDAWVGEEAKILRKKIRSNDLGGGCKLCGILINSGNYNGSKASYYDEYAHEGSKHKLRNLFGLEPKYHPKVFEFEISNTCNLACNMCSGYYSSTIRKKREKLPAMHHPYDNVFVKQVSLFLPMLTDLKFLGGEPFLIDIYFKIWEQIIAVNPKAKVHITTNGTVLNSKVKAVLSKLNVGIVISMDAASQELFEAIRIGAKWDKVIENFRYFKELTKEKNTYLSIAACAMNNNWKEIPKLVAFANKEEITIHFNVVWNPGHLSMRFLDYDELQEIEDFFLSQELPSNTFFEKNNRKVFEELILTVKHWKEERGFTRLKGMDDYENIPFQNIRLLENITPQTKNSELITILLSQLQKSNKDLAKAVELLQLSGNNLEEPTREALFSYWRKVGDYQFTEDFFNATNFIAESAYGGASIERFMKKTEALKLHVKSMKDQQAVISDLIDDVDRKSVLNQLQLINNNEATSLIEHINESY